MLLYRICIKTKNIHPPKWPKVNQTLAFWKAFKC